ncbi:MAG: hypothetical protein JWM23_572 [Microbacteriaceae bacterium]|nr:hypothetical protein [Microbacteriaceae bacterium]
MDCEVNSIICQLERIADALSQPPGPVEIWGGIVVPVVIGLATLAVALVSLKVARDATNLNRELHNERVSAEGLEKRVVVAAAVYEWMGQVLSDWRSPATAEKLNAAQSAVMRSAEPAVKDMWGWVLRELNPDSGHPYEGTEAIEMYRKLQGGVEQWVASPSAFKRVVQAELRVEALLRLADEYRSEE